MSIVVSLELDSSNCKMAVDQFGKVSSASLRDMKEWVGMELERLYQPIDMVMVCENLLLPILGTEGIRWDLS